MFQRFSFSKTSRILLSGLLLTSASMVMARPAKSAPAAREKSQEKPLDHMVTKLQKELDLTPGQTAQVREILRPDSSLGPWTRGEGMPFMGAEFIDQLRADQVDTTALNRTFAEQQARLAEHQKMRTFKLVQLHSVLTPAQRLKLADRLEKQRAQTSKQHRK